MLQQLSDEVRDLASEIFDTLAERGYDEYAIQKVTDLLDDAASILESLDL